jgi:hypothetical protein
VETKVFVQKMPKSIALAIAIGTIGCLLHDKPPPPRPALRGHPAVPRPEQAILSACVLAFNAGKLALRVLYFLNLLPKSIPADGCGPASCPEALPPCSAYRPAAVIVPDLFLFTNSSSVMYIFYYRTDSLSIDRETPHWTGFHHAASCGSWRVAGC